MLLMKSLGKRATENSGASSSRVAILAQKDRTIVKSLLDKLLSTKHLNSFLLKVLVNVSVFSQEQFTKRRTISQDVTIPATQT